MFFIGCRIEKLTYNLYTFENTLRGMGWKTPRIKNDPTDFYRGGWGVMMEKQGRRSWRIDEDEGLDSPASRGS